MLLLRPTPAKVETINDVDHFVTNFWRAIQHDPEAVATAADNPVNEADLHARHHWLQFSRPSAEFRERMKVDPDYYDCKIAGWWCWGLCCWIGGGWCQPSTILVSGNSTDQTILDISGSRGIHRRRPFISHPDGIGVHQSSGGRPQLADAVNANKRASTCEDRRVWLLDWFGRLRDRLRLVRVCCGDWERVCGSLSTTTRLGLTGVFFDPPYAHNVDRMQGWVRHLQGIGPEPAVATVSTSRSDGLYSSDADDTDHLVARVHCYCRARGDDPKIRMAVCGYAGEHDSLERLGWSCVEWKTQGGYANRGKDAETKNVNRDRERIWFSPSCVAVDRLMQRELTLEVYGEA